MPPIILPGGVVLDPHHAGAQHLQAYAQQLGLDRVQVFWATIKSTEQTFLVVEWPHPVLKEASWERVKIYLDTMAADQHVEKPH